MRLTVPLLALGLTLADGMNTRPLLASGVRPTVARGAASSTSASAIAARRHAIVMKDGDDDDNKNNQAPGGPNFGGVATTVAGLALAASLTSGVVGPLAPQQAPPAVVPYSVLLKEIKQNEVKEALFPSGKPEVFVRTTNDAAQRVELFPGAQNKLVDLMAERDVPFTVAPPESPPFLLQAFNFALNALPLLFLASIFLPRMGMGNPGQGAAGGPFGGMGGMLGNLGKSNAKLELEPDTGVTFQDVAGLEGSKLELTEIVDFLKQPGKYAKVGARSPKGVLLEGPPGTGKTLLARAVAGEAGVPFISASGSEFVEMFVGLGASRIRDLFKQAKENSPCIVFIDEIDAIGKSRSGGAGATGGGGNDEREQTLNQILTEMDGFAKNAGVVVIAATNRGDVLDSALLRPGRFDRRVPVDLPDRAGREAILGVHCRGKPLASDVDVSSIAARTTGFSGAALANLMNEAAIVTARRSKEEITMSEVEYALDRLTVGLEKRTGMASDARKRLVAYHEAGHALVGALTPGFDAVGKVTIVPRSNGAGGFTLFVPSEEQQDSGMYSRRYLESQLAVALGGRVAEELVFGTEDVTTGASGDLQRVADVARRMVTQWGFATDELGATAWESPQGTNIQTNRMASEKTQERIDEAVEDIVRRAYAVCRDTLEANRELLDLIVEELVEKETIGNDELMQLVRTQGVAPESLAAA